MDEWQDSYSKWRERRKQSLHSKVSLNIDELKDPTIERVQELKSHFANLRSLRSKSFDENNEDPEKFNQAICNPLNSNKDNLEQEALERVRSLIQQERKKLPDQAWEDRLNRLSNTLKTTSHTNSTADKNYLSPQSVNSHILDSLEIPILKNANIVDQNLKAEKKVSTPKSSQHQNESFKRNNVKIRLVKRPGVQKNLEENWGLVLKSEVSSHVRGSVLTIDKVKIGSSADLCDLKVGDILLALDNEPILDSTDSFLSLDEINQKLATLYLQERPINLLVQRPESDDDISDGFSHEEKSKVSELTQLNSNFDLQSQKINSKRTNLETVPIQRTLSENALLNTHEATLLVSPSEHIFQNNKDPIIGSMDKDLSSSFLRRDANQSITQPTKLNLAAKTDKPVFFHAMSSKPLNILETKSQTNEREKTPHIQAFEAFETISHIEEFVENSSISSFNPDEEENVRSISYHSEITDVTVMKYKTDISKDPFHTKIEDGIDTNNTKVNKSIERPFPTQNSTPPIYPRYPRNVWSSAEIPSSAVSHQSKKASPYTSPDEQYPRRRQPEINFVGSTTSSLHSVLDALSTESNQSPSRKIWKNDCPFTTIDQAYERVINSQSNPSLPPRNSARNLSNLYQMHDVSSSLNSLQTLLQAKETFNKQLKTDIPPRLPPRNHREASNKNNDFSRRICDVCQNDLGNGDLMVIEKLKLHYHLSCFRCSTCSCPLSDGLSDAEVRVRKGKLFCYHCYRQRGFNSNQQVKRTPQVPNSGGHQKLNQPNWQNSLNNSTLSNINITPNVKSSVNQIMNSYNCSVPTSTSKLMPSEELSSFWKRSYEFNISPQGKIPNSALYSLQPGR